MRIHPLTSRPASLARAFTLMELTMAMSIAMAMAGITMTLMQQQIAFLRVAKAQNFLVEEAPHINNAVSKLMGHADAFRIHTTFSTALAGTGAVTDNGTLLVLGFKDPETNELDFGIISFEDTGTETYLAYYNVDQFGAPPTEGSPDWIISRRVTNARFFVENGVFRMTLTGPNSETITYSGTPRL